MLIVSTEMQISFPSFVFILSSSVGTVTRLRAGRSGF